MVPLQLTIPDLDDPGLAAVELASDPLAQGGGTSPEDDDGWGAGLVVLAVILALAAVAVGLLGFRSLSRKKERVEHRDEPMRRR